MDQRLTKTQIVIKGVVIDTKTNEGRSILGKYGEMIFIKYLTDNEIYFKYKNENNIYSRYDFYIKNNNKKYIIELKCRIGELPNHNIEIIDYDKVDYYKSLIKYNKSYNNINSVFCFLHFKDENDYKIYFYTIDFDTINYVAFLNNTFDKKFYELSTENVKPIKELFYQ